MSSQAINNDEKSALTKIQYDIEVALARRLKNSTKEERIKDNLYTKLYDELYEKVPFHSQLTRKVSKDETDKILYWQFGLLKRFINKNTSFMEIGPGDCQLSFRVAKTVNKATAVDVSNIVTQNDHTPDNFTLLISTDGCSLPVDNNSIDVIYSNQLMEHLHPDDALEQLRNIYTSLSAGGRYICITPSRISGPWDVSKHFDRVAKGFHLKEYTFEDLNALFKDAGFKKTTAYVGARGKYIPFPVSGVIVIEKLLSLLPYNARVRLSRSLFLRIFLGIIIVGKK